MKESIANYAEASTVFDKEIAGQRHYGEVSLKASPLVRGAGNRFISDVSQEELPQAFIDAAQKGAMESLKSGSLMGYPAFDVEISLAGVHQKDSLSTELALYRECFNGLRRGSG